MYKRQGNHFNCPIVMSYSEALRLNIDELNETDVEFLNPFVPYDQKDHLKKRLYVELVEKHPELMKDVKGKLPSKKDIEAAVEAAWAEDVAFKEDIRHKGEETLKWMEDTGTHGIVLAGRPYPVSYTHLLFADHGKCFGDLFRRDLHGSSLFCA